MCVWFCEIGLNFIDIEKLRLEEENVKLKTITRIWVNKHRKK
jgi:hypothetical protein